MSRLEWILGILLVVLLLMVLALSAVLWFRSDEPQLPEGLPPTAVSNPPATSVYQEKTAQVGYAAAQRSMQDWYNDAALLDATATWSEGVTETSLRTGEANWAYTFYSAANNATALVTVLGDEANRISESPYTVSDPLADVGSWNIDSRQAIDLFLQEGGAQFLQDEGPSAMIMKLTATDGRMEWFLSLFANRNGRSFNMNIDATTGAVLQVETVP